jgi:chromosome segregation ATPase
MRRYAARCYTDPGTLSRYLKGTRVPPWNFIVKLLAHVAEERESQTSGETVALLRQLYVRAAGSSGGTRRASDLQHLLEEADEQAREAASLERLLQAALHESQQQVAHLNVELKTLRAARAADRQAVKAEIELFASEAEDLRRERDQLQAEIDVLKKQLKEATNARILAEERCDQLERQIESVEHEEKPTSQPEGRTADSEVSNEADELQERAAQEYAVTQKKMAAAQAHIAALQAELELARRDRLHQESTASMRDHLVSASPEENPAGRESRSLAVRLGYGPDQVLRRIDAANRVSPDDVREILTRAFDLQTSEEITRTGVLLESMPTMAQEAWKSVLSYSIKGSTITGQRRTSDPQRTE